MPYDAKAAAKSLPAPGGADPIDMPAEEPVDPECVAAYQEFESAQGPEAKALALKRFVQMYASGPMPVE